MIQLADLEKKNVQAEGVSENGEMSEELQKKLKELDKESNTAEYKGICAKVIAVICICFSLFQIYTGFFGALDAMIQRCVHLSFGICLVYLLCPTKKAWVKEGRFHPIDVALAVLAMIPPIYILVNYQQLILRAGTVTPTDTVIGVLGIVMIIEAARRIVGLPIVIVVCCFLAAASGEYGGKGCECQCKCDNFFQFHMFSSCNVSELSFQLMYTLCMKKTYLSNMLSRYLVIG